ncbi:MAG: VacJ family lipoprotein [Alphaproteobacteria bacterium]
MRAFPSLARLPLARLPLARVAVALSLVLGTAACATMPEDGDVAERVNDPLEPFNRQMFAVNLALDTFILRPAAVAYREIVPAPGKRAVRNFVNNLRSPLTLVHDIAQGEWDRAQITYGRFLMNSTLGLGGLIDLAGDHYGLPYHEEDAGQTLAVWGIGEGPYLVLPGFGPSNFRDALGRGIDWYIDPVGIAADEGNFRAVTWTAAGLNAVDTRYRTLGQFDAMRRRSLDFYATVRSAHRQRRAAQIENRTAADAE